MNRKRHRVRRKVTNIMIIDVSSLKTEIDAFAAAVVRIVELLTNDAGQQAVIDDLTNQLNASRADDETNVATINDLTSQLHAANEQLNAALPPVVEE